MKEADRDIEMAQLMSPGKIKTEAVDAEEQEPTWKQTVTTFMFCFCGLQVSYLTWGVMQELIMTTVFEPTEHVPDGVFPSATFCVFSNRIIAIIVAVAICYRVHGTVKSSAPIYALIPCALSNTTSSFCQYASLGYVDFPLQNLFKSTKVIPVMLMGKFLKGTTYPWVQYGEALLITFGVIIFSQADFLADLLGMSDKDGTEDASDPAEADATAEVEVGTFNQPSASLRFIGICLLTGYILSDSFTSQWQSKVYADYGKIDQYHMMFAVNFWAILMTIAALIVSGEIPVVIEFLIANPKALMFNIITGITSTTGQLFIYYTIKRFGPVALTIIMTTRQMFSICISAVTFGHVIPIVGVLGVLVVFGTVFTSIHRQYKAKIAKDALAARP